MEQQTGEFTVIKLDYYQKEQALNETLQDYQVVRNELTNKRKTIENWEALMSKQTEGFTEEKEQIIEEKNQLERDFSNLKEREEK